MNPTDDRVTVSIIAVVVALVVIGLLVSIVVPQVLSAYSAGSIFGCFGYGGLGVGLMAVLVFDYLFWGFSCLMLSQIDNC